MVIAEVLKSIAKRRYITNGTVACPVSQCDRDVEACLTCGRMTSMATDHRGREYLTCTGRSSPAAGLPRVFD